MGIDGDRLVEPDGTFDHSVSLGPGELRPGLVNAHDHLHRNHFPRLGSPPYPDVYSWGEDIHARWAGEIARARAVGRREALLFGAFKNLLGGVTSVVHHDPREPDFEAGFPVRVVRTRTAHSLGLDAGLAAAHVGDPALPLSVHVAEGTTPAVADEVRKLDDLGWLDGRLLAVHAVGVDRDGIERLRARGAALVWCPSSNEFLYGRTAPRELLDSGIDVLLGTDSLLSGVGTLLDELGTARDSGLLGRQALLDAVGPTAARRLGLPRPVLRAGAPADLVHLRRPLGDATAEDVALVVVGGVPRLGDEGLAEVFERLGLPIERVAVGRTVKLVTAPLGSVVERIVAEFPEAGRVLGNLPDALDPHASPPPHD